MAVVALLTDFGTDDHYVASMKGAILRVNPKATLVDISHHVPPQDVFRAAFILRQVLPFFPAETVFVAVVDPTVGTERRILAGRYSDRIVLAPDNGLLTFVHRDADLQEVRVVENRRLFASQLSATFQGRDIFAPVAGHLSAGTDLHHVGPIADRIEVLQLPRVIRHPDGTIEGQICYIDHFGNLITNISVMDLSAERTKGRTLTVHFKNQVIGPIRITYADVPPGQPVAVVGSTQMVEIAVNHGSAAQTFAAQRGDAVFFR